MVKSVAGEDQAGGASEVARQLLVGVQRVLVDADLRPVRQRLRRPAAKRQQRRRDLVHPHTVALERGGHAVAIEQARHVAGLVAEQRHLTVGVEHRDRHRAVAVARPGPRPR